jgi:thiamine kinase-like enzyme
MTESLQRIADLPIWSGPVSPEPLSGGLSNESYTVEDRGRKLVVRLGKDYPFHHVERARELMSARAAVEAGFAPEVIYDEPGLVVTAFVEGATYGEEEVRANQERIADLMRRFHQTMPRHVSGAGFIFWVFHVIRDYARTLDRGGSRFSQDLEGFVGLAEELEAVQEPLPIVFGHHDLLPANFLDDGKRLWLIDYEYAGFGTAMFDLAGLASNAGFDAARDEALLERYFGARPGGALLRSHAAMKCASLLREAMWSMVSELYLEAPGVDYEAYTRENLDRLTNALDRYHSTFGKA